MVPPQPPHGDRGVVFLCLRSDAQRCLMDFDAPCNNHLQYTFSGLGLAISSVIQPKGLDPKGGGKEMEDVASMAHAWGAAASDPGMHGCKEGDGEWCE